MVEAEGFDFVRTQNQPKNFHDKTPSCERGFSFFFLVFEGAYSPRRQLQEIPDSRDVGNIKTELNDVKLWINGVPKKRIAAESLIKHREFPGKISTFRTRTPDRNLTSVILSTRPFAAVVFTRGRCSSGLGAAMARGTNPDGWCHHDIPRLFLPTLYSKPRAGWRAA